MSALNSIQEQTAAQLLELVRWATQCSAEDIPEQVYAKAALVLFDDLAAMVSATADPAIMGLIAQLKRCESRPEASVFCANNYRTDCLNAAWANGVAGSCNELDEGSLRVSCHSGIYVLPALLAEAESKALTGFELLRALVIGYEVVTRIAACFQQQSLRIHPHAAFAAMGACAGIASARRYNENQMLSMVTTASTCVHPGPFGHAVGGSFMRNIWVANGSRAGLQVADWIHLGIEGLAQSPLQVFKDILGFKCLPEQLTQNVGVDWAILANFHKLYPCCQFAHSAIEAIAALLTSLPDGYQPSVEGQLKEIRIETHEKARLLDNYDPVNMLAARFSLPHIAAVMVVHGVVDTQTLSTASLREAAVIKVRKLVKIKALRTTRPPPNDRACRVTFCFQDGKEYESECLCARGSQSNPLALDVLKQKIHRITADSYPKLHLIMERFIGLERFALKSSWTETVSLMKENHQSPC